MNETVLDANEQRLLEIWQQHTVAEFVLKDSEAALATMTNNPYVLCMPVGTGGIGREGVWRFYSQDFIPQNPVSMELTTLVRTFGRTRMVEEMLVTLTHDIKMEWFLPGLEPTGKAIELIIIGIVEFEEDKIAGERLYWDHNAVLAQLGLKSVSSQGEIRGNISNRTLLSLLKERIAAI